MTHHTVRSVAWTAALVLIIGIVGYAQEKISPASDYQYKRDYAQYEKLKTETDLQKKADALVAFMKEHPISRMLGYVQADYLASLKPHMDAKDWAKVAALEEAFAALMPTEKTVAAAQVPEPGAGEFIKGVLKPAEKLMQQSLMAAYFQGNNMAKAVAIAEKNYAENPTDPQALGVVMEIYRKAFPEKAVALTEKLANEAPIEKSFPTVMQLADSYAAQKNLDKAVEYATKIVQAFGEKVPPGVQEAEWNPVRARAYGYIAASIYAKKDYPQAIGLYEKISKIDPKADSAYYYIGMCKWQTKDQEGAIPYFAKAVVLGKDFSKRAQGYLEQLYKARHNDSLDGLDQVIAKAKADLGIS
jgi:tetratricopeptide (TPR) repeat protein